MLSHKYMWLYVFRMDSALGDRQFRCLLCGKSLRECSELSQVGKRIKMIVFKQEDNRMVCLLDLTSLVAGLEADSEVDSEVDLAQDFQISEPLLGRSPLPYHVDITSSLPPSIHSSSLLPSLPSSLHATASHQVPPRYLPPHAREAGQSKLQ